MKTKLVTCIYFDLHGTDLGGRPSRNDHYLYSLNSIMRIDNADFVIYTNDKQKVEDFYLNNYSDKLTKFECFEYDLYNTEYSDLINPIKNTEETKQSTRCIELQYSKLTWLKNNCSDYDYVYWIDAGLCYSGLIPDKYLNVSSEFYFDRYYGSEIFGDSFVNNMNSFSGKKIMVCAKENIKHYWDKPLPSCYFKDNNTVSSYHIIGGLFGGDAILINDLYDKFFSLSTKLMKQSKKIFYEENILSCLFFNYPEMFVAKHFDIWWHEDNIISNVDNITAKRLLNESKSFYRILEEFF
jgi:hypothetical protein